MELRDVSLLAKTNIFDLAPEIINNSKVSKMADYWSLGCVLFELLVGETPFPRDNKHPVYELMDTVSNSYTKKPTSILKFPEERQLSTQVKDLITRLLLPDPSERLGSWHGSSDVKCHVWFKEIPRWKAVEDLLIEPPHIPDLYFYEEPERNSKLWGDEQTPEIVKSDEAIYRSLCSL